MIFKSKKECPGIILLRIHPQTVEYVTLMLEKVIAMKIAFEKSFCVVEKNKIRVIPLEKEW